MKNDKIHTSIATMLTLSLTSFSQAVSIKDLVEKSNCIDSACFNNFITKRGFSFTGTYDTVDQKAFKYASNKRFATTSNPGLSLRNQVSFSIYIDGSIRLGFGTGVKSQYEKLIEEMTALKYQAGNTINQGDGTFAVEYNSTEYLKVSVTVRTFLLEKKGLGSWTFYDFAVLRRQ